MPKIEKRGWQDHPGGPHPLTGEDTGPHSDIPLGDMVGLAQFGVHLERLPPGSKSSHRHWHETEDEFVYVLSGTLVLVEDEDVTLTAGDAAGWKAGVPVAHCIENRSGEDAVILVVGTRAAAGVVHYPDHDLVLRHEGEVRTFSRTDGTPVDPTG